MSTVSFHLFDERRSGVRLGPIQPALASPLAFDRDNPPRWATLVPSDSIHTCLARRDSLLTALIDGCGLYGTEADVATIGGKLGAFRPYTQYLTALADLITQLTIGEGEDDSHQRPAGILPLARDRERLAVLSWAATERAATLYNLAIAKARLGTAQRFSLGYATEDAALCAEQARVALATKASSNSNNNNTNNTSVPTRIGAIHHVQRLFEEAAGLTELLSNDTSNALLSSSSKVEAMPGFSREQYPQLDSHFLRAMTFALVGCAEESHWLYHTVENKDARHCALLASSVGHSFAQAHANLAPMRTGVELRDGLSNALLVKRGFYNGCAQLFFAAGRSIKRRQKARDHFIGALRELNRVGHAFRSVAAEEIGRFLREAETDPTTNSTHHPDDMVVRFPTDAAGKSKTQKVRHSSSVAASVLALSADDDGLSEPDQASPKDKDGEEAASSRAKPVPRIPKELHLVRMYQYWKRWTVRRHGGMEADVIVGPAKEWWEDDDETDLPINSPAARDAAKKRAAMVAKSKARSGVATSDESPVSLSLRCRVAHRDLFTGGLCEADDPFVRSTNLLVDVRANRSPTREEVRLCLVLIVDCTGSIDMGPTLGSQKGMVQAMLKELLSCTGLTCNDHVGVVVFPLASSETGAAGGQPRVVMHKMDEDGLRNILATLESLRPTNGTPITEGVAAAVRHLEHTSIQASAYEVLVFTDGHDCQDFATGWRNWGSFHKTMAALAKTHSSPKRIRAHGFAIGLQADKYLVEAMALKGGGDFYLSEATKEGLSVIRTWFLKHFADQFHTVASAVTLEVVAVPGVTITQLGSDGFGAVVDHATEAHFPPLPDADPFNHNRDDTGLPRTASTGSLQLLEDNVALSPDLADATPSERDGALFDWLPYENKYRSTGRSHAAKVVLPLEDFCDGHETSVPIVLRIARPCIRRLETDLCRVTLRYTDASTGQQVQLSGVPEPQGSGGGPDGLVIGVNGAPQLLDRHEHLWLVRRHAALVTLATGSVTVQQSRAVPPQPRLPVPLHPGSWLELGDAIVVPKKGVLELRYADNTSVRVEGEASLEAPDPHSKEDTGKQDESQEGQSEGPGPIRINLRYGAVEVTTPVGACVVVDCEQKYSLRIGPRSCAKLAWAKGTLRCSCVQGLATLQYPGSAGAGGGVVVPPLRELSAANGQPPTPAVLLAETALQQWLARDPALSVKLDFEDHVNRVLTGQCLVKAAGLIRSNYRSKEPREALRCREFLVRYFSTECTVRMSNSLAYSTKMARLLKDVQNAAAAIAVCKPLPKDKPCAVKLESFGYALQRQRPRGVTDLFVPDYQTHFLRAYADARAQEELDRQEKLRLMEKQAVDAEAERRREALGRLFGVWDLDGSGFVEFHELQQVFLPLTREHLNPTAASVNPGMEIVIDRWRDLLEEGVIGLELDRGQLEVLLGHLTQDLTTYDFERVVTSLTTRLGLLNTLTSRTRQDRALWNLFLLWDRLKVGFLDADEVIQLIYSVPQRLGSDIPLFRESAAFHEMRCALQQGEDEEDRDRSTERNQQEGSAEWVKVDFQRFHEAMRTLLGGCEELELHNALYMVRCELLRGNIDHISVQHAYETASGDERERLVSWDMRHCFDGVTAKDVRRLSDPKTLRENGDKLRAACRVCCVLTGIEPSQNKSANKLRHDDEDWLEAIRTALEQDLQAFLDFLRGFPVGSITFRQAQAVHETVSDITFQPALYAVCGPLVASLVGWTRIVMRICHMDNGWTLLTSEERRVRQEQHAKVPEELQKGNGHLLCRPKDTSASSNANPTSPTSSTALRSPTYPGSPQKKIQQQEEDDEPAMNKYLGPEDRARLLAKLGAGRLSLGRVEPPQPTTTLYHFHSPEEGRRVRVSQRGSAHPLDDLPDGGVTPFLAQQLRSANPTPQPQFQSQSQSMGLSFSKLSTRSVSPHPPLRSLAATPVSPMLSVPGSTDAWRAGSATPNGTRRSVALFPESNAAISPRLTPRGSGFNVAASLSLSRSNPSPSFSMAQPQPPAPGSPVSPRTTTPSAPPVPLSQLQPRTPLRSPSPATSHFSRRSSPSPQPSPSASPLPAALPQQNNTNQPLERDERGGRDNPMQFSLPSRSPSRTSRGGSYGFPSPPPNQQNISGSSYSGPRSISNRSQRAPLFTVSPTATPRGSLAVPAPSEVPGALKFGADSVVLKVPPSPTASYSTFAPMSATFSAAGLGLAPNGNAQGVVAQWLESIGLSQYREALEREGYEDLADVAALVHSHSHTFERLVPKEGHRTRMARMLPS